MKSNDGENIASSKVKDKAGLKLNFTFILVKLDFFKWIIFKSEHFERCAVDAVNR